MNFYFILGTISTYSFHAWLLQLTDQLVAGLISLAGGLLSSFFVAWLKNHWQRKK